MSVVQTIKSVLPIEAGADTTEYRCNDCGNTFESPEGEEPTCMSCISSDVEEL